MKFFWLLFFLGLATGVLLSPVFAVVIFLVPLVFLKRIETKVLAFAVIIGAILGIRSVLPGSYEMIGFVTQVRARSVIATDVMIWKDKWMRLKHDVQVNSDELPLGYDFYAYGEIESRVGYPAYVLTPHISQSTRRTLRGFEKLRASLFIWRERFQQLLLQSLKDKAQIAESLFFSQRTLDDNLSSAVKRSGLSHVFAVSGLHVAIVYGFLEILVSIFTYRMVPRRIITTILTMLYALSTGPTPSALRAAMMLMIWNVFKIMDYPVHPLNVLGLVGTANVFLEPYSVLSPSFLMSYSGAGAIVLLTQKLSKRRLLQPLVVSTSAFIGVSPFVSLLYGLNPLSPIFSIPAIYIATLCLCGLALGSIVNLLGMIGLSEMLLKGTYPFLTFLEHLIHFASVFSFTLEPNIVAYVFCCAFLLILFWHFLHNP